MVDRILRVGAAAEQQQAGIPTSRMLSPKLSGTAIPHTLPCSLSCSPCGIHGTGIRHEIMPPSSSNRAHSPRGDSVSEQTPLLAEQQPLLAPPSDEEPQVPLATEPTTKELILVLGSIWVGVFLAALGMVHR